MEVPNNRKMHVTRIFGTNAEGEVLKGLWCDVLRLDTMVYKTQDTVHQRQFTVQGQRSQIRLDWNDKDGEDRPSETRETVEIRVCAPDQDPENPTEWVPIPSIRRVRLKSGNVKNNRLFLDFTDDEQSDRDAEVCRFYHYDTNIDEDAAASGEDVRVFRVTADEYQKILSSVDESTYVDQNVVIRFRGRAVPHWLESPVGANHKMTFLMKNQFLIDNESDGPGGTITKVYDIDPFQCIINCQFAPTVIVAFYNVGSPLDVEIVANGVTDYGTSTISGLHVRLMKVNSGLNKVFARVTSSTTLNAITSQQCAVFAMLGDDVASVNRAVEALSSLSSQPTGLLLLTTLGNGALMQGGSTANWKIAYKPHRTPGSSSIPNTMVQCFPVDVSPSRFGGQHLDAGGSPNGTFAVSITGYFVDQYRLDRRAEGPVYEGGRSHGGTALGDNLGRRGPSQWRASKVTNRAIDLVGDPGLSGESWERGISFASSQKQFPLIPADIPYSPVE